MTDRPRRPRPRRLRRHRLPTASLTEMTASAGVMMGRVEMTAGRDATATRMPAPEVTPP